MSQRPACGVHVCPGFASCTKCCNVCKTPTGPTVNAAADMMSWTVAARTQTEIFPVINTQRGVKLTRPSHYDVNRSQNITAFLNSTYCCT